MRCEIELQLVLFALLHSGEHRLPACRSRQLAETGIGVRMRLRRGRCCRHGCRQLLAGSLCSPDACASQASD
jgi:hypothetical protein